MPALVVLTYDSAVLWQSWVCLMGTALTRLRHYTMALARGNREEKSLLEGESDPTPAEETIPTPYQQDRPRPSLENGEGLLSFYERLRWHVMAQWKMVTTLRRRVD